MLVTSLATFCCGMASHSPIRICDKSANMVLLVTLACHVQLDQADPPSLVALLHGPYPEGTNMASFHQCCFFKSGQNPFMWVLGTHL